jgi:PKD repeat protein
VFYSRSDASTEVTIGFTVLGIIDTLNLDMENEEDLIDILLNSTEPLPLAYVLYVETDATVYQIIYSGGNCTLGHEQEEEIDYEILDNEFSAIFNLESNDEVISKIGAQSMFVQFSMTSSGLYVDAAPDSFMLTAEAEADPLDATTGEEIEFTGTVVNLEDFSGIGLPDTGYTYQWDFNDGSSGAGETVSHSFQYPGTYSVELTVEDENGNTATDIVQVTISQGNTSNNGNTNGNGDTDGESSNGLLMFVVVIAIIIIIGIFAVIFVIRR